MKRRILLSILVIGLLAGFVFLAASFIPNQKAIDSTLAQSLYQTAATQAREQTAFVMEIKETIEISEGENLFSQSSQKTVSYLEKEDGTVIISLDEALQSGKHSANIQEIYADGTVYAAVNDCLFSSPSNLEDYQAALMPLVMLDQKLYGSITGLETANGYTISLRQPTQAELWVVKDAVSLVDSWGYAYLDKNGKLLGSSYYVQYQVNGIIYTYSGSNQINETAPEISIPENTDAYTEISFGQGPRLLEIASGYLTQVCSLTATGTETTYFQAFGDKRVKEQTVEIFSNDKLQVSSETTLSNDIRVSQDSLSSQTEVFIDGSYAITKSGVTTERPEITEEDMLTYCQNLLVSTVVLPQHILNCEAAAQDNTLRITFTGNDVLAQQLKENACNSLYQQPDMLDTAKKFKTTLLLGYLDLDKSTGIPIGSGIQMHCSYYTGGIPYELTLDAKQSYNFGE